METNSQRSARQVVGVVRDRLDALSPRTELATVADITYQKSIGYITATTLKGPIQVFGCPNGIVAPGSSILVRKITRSGATYYVYDGPSLGSTKGTGYAIMGSDYTVGLGSIYSQGIAHTGTLEPTQAPSAYWSLASGGTTVPANALTTGWYWSFFFLISSLPSSNSTINMFTTGALFNTGNGFNTLSPSVNILYDWQGRIGLTYGDGVFTTGFTTQTFAPGRIWFLQLQLGGGMSVNGVSTTPPSNIGSLALPIQGTIVHGIGGASVLPSQSGTNKAPLGSWFSKMQFGFFPALSGLPYAQNGFVPTSDSQILNGNSALNAGLTTYDRFLVSDGSSGSLPNTGVSAVAMTPHYPSSRVSIGPYIS
jgi:hypothetical protein